MTRRLVDLSVPLMNFTMELPDFTPQITYLSPAEVARRMSKAYHFSPDDIPGGTHLATELVSLSTHAGTHVDAPSHYGPRADGTPPRTLDQVPLEWCIGNGVVFDFSRKQAGEYITAEDLAGEATRIGHDPTDGDIALIRTDWHKRYYKHDYASAHPGLTRASCEWLLDRGVRVIGVDTNSVDLPAPMMVEKLKAGDRAQFYQCHYLGRERDYLQIEKLANLDQLPPTGFTVIAFPVLIAGSGGAWTRAVAVLND